MTGFALRVRQDLRSAALPRAFAIATGAGVFLALIGPFGTAAATIAQRMIYWLTLAEIGTGLGVLTTAIVTALADPEDKRPFAVAALTSVAMTLPAVVVVYAFTRAMFQDRALVSSGGLLGFIPPVFLVTTAMTFVNALAHRTPVHTHASADDAEPSRFIARLPARLRGADLYAVEAEDHYLRLHTSKGSDLILMRLSDAIAELDGVEGAQTHRSWWVARSAVRGARRMEGRAMLELPGGVEAPVSRNYARALRAEGWF